MASPLRGDDANAVSNVPRVPQPPRPPNSWILYRAHKLKNLPPVGIGEPRRSQSEVSTMISRMWREENDEVRAEYERLAEEAKALHKIKFPNYRYQPKPAKKKEEAERLAKQQKEAKRLGRMTRGQQEDMPVPMYAGPAIGAGPYYIPQPYPQFVYGPAGPSPPLSLASTPTDTTGSPSSSGQGSISSPASFPTPLPPPLPPNTNPVVVLPYPAAASVSSTPPTPEILADPPSGATDYWKEDATVVEQSPVKKVENEQCKEPTSVTQAETSSWESETLVNREPLMQDGASAPWDNTPVTPFDNLQGSNDFLDFNIPPMPPFLDGIDFSFPLDGGTDLFLLNNFDPSTLLQEPYGEVEICVGTQPHPPENAFFDLPVNGSSLSNPFESHQESFTSMDAFNQMFLHPDVFSNARYSMAEPSSAQLYTIPDEFLATESQEHSDNHQANEQLSIVEYPSSSTHATPASSYAPTPALASTYGSSSSTYTPPAGASYSSTRRVGGNWGHSAFVRENVLGQSPRIAS